MFAYTGCRVSEPGSLKVRDFGEEQGYGFLGFTVKGGKRNRVHLHPECTAALKAYLHAAGHGAARDMPLFLQAKGAISGKPMHRKSFELVFRRYAAEVELPAGATPHSLRATFVTEALEKGCAVESVQRTVGHANVATTLMYDKRRMQPKDSASLTVRF